MNKERLVSEELQIYKPMFEYFLVGLVIDVLEDTSGKKYSLPKLTGSDLKRHIPEIDEFVEEQFAKVMNDMEDFISGVFEKKYLPKIEKEMEEE